MESIISLTSRGFYFVKARGIRAGSQLVLERRRWICARASSGEWITGNSEFPGAKSRLGVNQPVRWSLSFCLQPKWRSVVSTDACLANTESDQSHLLPDGTIARRSGAGIGARFVMAACFAAAFTTCHIAFGVMLSPQTLSKRLSAERSSQYLFQPL
jgi:hypothetical protein